MPTPEQSEAVDQRATWIRDMLEYYQETGQVRVEDADRLLGDPTGQTTMPRRDEISAGDNALFS